MRNEDYYYLKMETHFLTVPYQEEKRRVRVLLPKDYQKDTETYYPVIYFHDGQNVFHSGEAFSGHSWKVIPAIKRNPELPKMIIVGIDNDGENRLNEYIPWRISNTPFPGDIHLGGQGYDYASFVMEVVVPFINEQYRTKADKKHTAMIGSSLGGNISAFMGIEYNNNIGGLGIFSLANWISEMEFAEYISGKSIEHDQRIYIQVGTRESNETDRHFIYGNMNQAYLDSTLNYTRRLIEKGILIDNIDLNIFADGEHTEAAWAEHLPQCLRFLSQDW
ncbi:alpha/beta hydrolase [Aerococcaceae bacterium DSM 111020]|nr:alpha/beta hydrolase [Aerococcaceae bacterium DSM 111020]